MRFAASMPSGPSRSSTTIPLRAPVAMPTFAPGHRLHQPRTTDSSPLALSVQLLMRGCLPTLRQPRPLLQEQPPSSGRCIGTRQKPRRSRARASSSIEGAREGIG